MPCQPVQYNTIDISSYRHRAELGKHLYESQHVFSKSRTPTASKSVYDLPRSEHGSVDCHQTTEKSASRLALESNRSPVARVMTLG